MRRRAAILIQRGGAAPDRQADICGPYCLENHYSATIVPYWAPEQALQLVRDGLVDIVVVAYENRALTELVGEIAEAGGQTIAVHPEPRVLEPPPRRLAPTRWVTQMVARWHHKGMKARQIADLLGEDTTEVQAVLLRIGIDPTRK